MRTGVGRSALPLPRPEASCTDVQGLLLPRAWWALYNHHVCLERQGNWDFGCSYVLSLCVLCIFF